MGFFDKKEKKIIEKLCKKSEDHCKEISKEIDEMLKELSTEYDQNKNVIMEFVSYVEELKTKLNPEDRVKLIDFSNRLNKIKQCAKRGVEAMRELSRDQRKITRETMLEYEEYFTYK